MDYFYTVQLTYRTPRKLSKAKKLELDQSVEGVAGLSMDGECVSSNIDVSLTDHKVFEGHDEITAPLIVAWRQSPQS